MSSRRSVPVDPWSAILRDQCIVQLSNQRLILASVGDEKIGHSSSCRKISIRGYAFYFRKLFQEVHRESSGLHSPRLVLSMKYESL